MSTTVEGFLFYTCIQKPVDNYDKDGTEYKVTVCVSEDDADAFEDVKKELKVKYPEVKTVKTTEFEALYKVPAPFPDQKKQFLLTFKRKAGQNDGTPIDEQYRPKVFAKNNEGKFVDVTASKLVGNGSEGVVKFSVFETQKYGNFTQLVAVKVTELIEYEAPNKGDDDGFYDDVLKGKEVKSEAKEVAKPKETARPTKEDKKVVKPAGKVTPVDESDDLPF